MRTDLGFTKRRRNHGTGLEDSYAFVRDDAVVFDMRPANATATKDGMIVPVGSIPVKGRLLKSGGRGGLKSCTTVVRLQTLKRNSTTSPSFMTYCLPSMRTFPATLAADMLPAATRSS